MRAPGDVECELPDVVTAVPDVVPELPDAVQNLEDAVENVRDAVQQLGERECALEDRVPELLDGDCDSARFLPERGVHVQELAFRLCKSAKCDSPGNVRAALLLGTA